MIQLLGTILRGLRARALLSAGSVLLAALAVGSAVLGPIFSEAVTNSYVVTRLQEAPRGVSPGQPRASPRTRLRPRAGRARRPRSRSPTPVDEGRGASPTATLSLDALQRAARRRDLLVARATSAQASRSRVAARARRARC